MARSRSCATTAALACLATTLAACSTGNAPELDITSAERPVVVTSTPLLAELASHVAPDADIRSLMPAGADPHSFEPSMRALRDVTRADIAFSNGLLLERQSLTDTINAHIPDGVQHITLGDAAVRYGASHIPLVEDLALSTVWLGLAVHDDQHSLTNSGTVSITAVEASGPGNLAAFTTGTFGTPKPYITSSDGIDDTDTIELPLNAHTHMSWGFSQPGSYQLTLDATLHSDDGDRDLGRTTLAFRVGSASSTAADGSTLTSINNGHFDIATSLSGGITLQGEKEGRTLTLDPASVVVEVPHTTATTIPDGSWRFLAAPGTEAWILAQAVLGEHVHGEIDPHLWLDVRNAIAYVEAIADELAHVNPTGAANYRENAAEYVSELEELDSWATEVIGSIPAKQRELVTAHDAFGYFARAYGLNVVGFVSPNPTLEPSVQQLANLSRVITDSAAPAVFIDPTAGGQTGQLVNLAHTAGAHVCELYSDSFTPDIHSYIGLIEHNVRAMKSCLDPDSLPAWPRTTNVPTLTRSPSAPNLKENH